ncbi:MAG TPA: molybdenum cofactor guanylyltransferase MobA [Stellaceae bacterium]|jgi:molybdenum cofactor guanylyltransferase|nr:molybdenum cofactor guanylyltransferase MobA [Stellaceae bacterium]
MKIAGVLLAGGQSQRMGGGDKNLRPLGGKPMLAHVIERAKPQVDALVLNANGDPQRFAGFGLPIIADSISGFAGPLAGVLAGLDWAARNLPEAELVASFATDAPFFPRDLVRRLAVALEEGGFDLACAQSNGQAHPVFALWPVSLRDALREALAGGLRKVDRWTARYKLVEVEFAAEPVDPFFNANRPDDLAEAERLVTLAL